MDDYLRINEIKNYIYCPRIAFYALCLRLDRETALSQMGIENEQLAKRRMKRRKHALHTVHNGKRHFDVPVVHHGYRLVGRLDEVVETEQGLYLVDYKDTLQDFGYWKVQMLAYRLCLEEAGEAVQGCYIYAIANQTYHPVESGKRDARKLADIVQALYDMLESEICPPPTPHIGKCRTCQYRRYCNDVL